MALKSAFVAALCLVAAGCSAERERWVARRDGRPADIRCLSYGQVLYQGRSTGRIRQDRRSDRIEFIDAATGRLNVINGDCRIVYVR